MADHLARSADHDPLAVRRRFAARLRGRGMEIGPGHAPFPVPQGLTVRYLDRWEPSENSALFPELGSDPGFPKPDIVADLDVDRLSSVPDCSQDFVIASHILEHLANPLAMLVDIHRVTRPGGLMVLILPDRHVTFDSERPPTSLEHLTDEYRRDVREVADDHVIEAIVAQVRFNGDTRDAAILAEERTISEIELHRRRSIHAHVWDMGEFCEVLAFARRELAVSWTVLDLMPTGTSGSYGNEFGWLLSREEQAGRRGRRDVRRLWNLLARPPSRALR
ncbi:MAG: methyltransferase domain-containing protein [Acidimicrobiales bacterium]